jgi:putative transposase
MVEVSGVDTLYLAPGSLWENGYVESFNSKLRDEFWNLELFLHIDELRYVADRWRMDCNRHRLHSSLGDLTPMELGTGYFSYNWM